MSASTAEVYRLNSSLLETMRVMNVVRSARVKAIFGTAKTATCCENDALYGFFKPVPGDLLFATAERKRVEWSLF